VLLGGALGRWPQQGRGLASSLSNAAAAWDARRWPAFAERARPASTALRSCRARDDAPPDQATERDALNAARSRQRRAMPGSGAGA
jgi:hypothetical protein